MRPESVFSKKFSKAFIAGERSDVATHKALIEGLVEFHRNDHSTVGLAWAVRFMQERNAKSARFHAIVKWLESVAKFEVTISDDPAKSNVKTRKKQAYGKGWLDGAKKKTWYQTARDMQVAKGWSNPLDRMIREFARGYLMGDIDRAEMVEEIGAKSADQAIRTAMSDAKLQAEVAERMTKLDKQGDLTKKAA